MQLESVGRTPRSRVKGLQKNGLIVAMLGFITRILGTADPFKTCRFFGSTCAISLQSTDSRSQRRNPREGHIVPESPQAHPM